MDHPELQAFVIPLLVATGAFVDMVNTLYTTNTETR